MVDHVANDFAALAAAPVTARVADGHDGGRVPCLGGLVVLDSAKVTLDVVRVVVPACGAPHAAWQLGRARRNISAGLPTTATAAASPVDGHTERVRNEDAPQGSADAV